MAYLDGFPPINDILWRIVFVDFVLCIFMEARSQCYNSLTKLVADSNIHFFMSPGYPVTQYALNEECDWQIAALNQSHVVRIDVEDSLIEYHKNCEWDFVRVFDGRFDTSKELGKFCGSDEPTYVSSGQYMYVKLVSDFSQTFRGFRIKYYSGKRESLTESNLKPISTNNTTIIVGASFGGMFLVVVLSGIAYSCYTSKKRKSQLRRLRGHRTYDQTEIQPRRAVQSERQHAWNSFHTNASVNYSRPPCYTPGPPPPYREPSTLIHPMSPPPPYEYIAPNQAHSFASPTANT